MIVKINRRQYCFHGVEMWATIAAIAQVGPDDVLLGEAEDSQSTSSHCGIYDDARVRHHLRTLIETNSAPTENIVNRMMPRFEM